MLMLAEHADTVEGLLTHVATTDCFLTLPHSALAGGIVTAWWRLQGEGDTLVPALHDGERGPRAQQGPAERPRPHPPGPARAPRLPPSHRRPPLRHTPHHR